MVEFTIEVVASSQHRESVVKEILLDPGFLKGPLRRGFDIGHPLRIAYKTAGMPAMDSKPIQEHRRTRPSEETLCIELKLEIEIAEISGSLAYSTDICENFPVV